MNYKLFLTVLAVLTIITTLCICAMRPKMHKSVMVYNSDFKIVPQSEIQVEVQNIPTVEQNQSSAPQAVKVIHFEDMDNDIVTDYQTTTSQNVNVSTQTSVPQRTTSSSTVYTTTQTKPQYTTQTQSYPTQTKVAVTTPKTTTTTKVQTPTTTTTKVNTPQKVTTSAPQIDLQKILENNKKYQNAQTQQPTTTTVQTPVKTTTTTPTTKVVSAPVGTKTVTTTPSATTRVPTPAPATTTKVLTPQEEEIAWQIWRSNLQNKIMQDAKLPNVPQGTIFKFTFDVDKYGKVSNIHTSCTNNVQYTPYAIQYIAPVIRAYQGRSILNFPEGSKRVTTSFVGSFKVSNSSRYSTAGDYKDTERISR